MSDPLLPVPDDGADDRATDRDRAAAVDADGDADLLDGPAEPAAPTDPGQGADAAFRTPRPGDRASADELRDEPAEE